jgi:hypothetical protein
VIQRVEHLEAQLRLEAFARGEVLDDAEVEVGETRSDEGISSKDSVGPESVGGER